MNYYSAFLESVRFLTIIPAGKADNEYDFRKIIVCFPAAGMVIGIAIGLIWLGVSAAFPALFSAAVSVIALAALTGGLHLDGAADLADGILCRKGKEKALEVMKDPRVGAMGAAAIAGVLILKITALAMFSRGNVFSVIIAVCTVSRWSMLVPMTFFDYARPAGTGEAFTRQADPKLLVSASLFTLAIGVITAGPAALILILSTGITAYAVGLLAHRSLGGVTGDVYGAVNEVNEILALAILFLFKGTP